MRQWTGLKDNKAEQQSEAEITRLLTDSQGMKNRSYPLITRFSASPLQSLLHVHNMRACALWHLLRDTAKDAEGLVFAILMTGSDLVQLTTGSKATVERAHIIRRAGW